MAHVVTQGARRRLAESKTRPASGAARTLAVVALFAALAWNGAPARAAEDEIVPAGAWLVQAKVTQENQREAIATDGQRHPLVDYLAQQPGLAGALSGQVVRNVTAAEVLIGYGISDTWNLNLAVPYLTIRQESSLDAGSGSPAAAGAVDTLKSRTVSGLGNVRLISLHRTLFTDNNGLVLGWGAVLPGGPQQTDYTGRTTLDTRVPYRTLTGLFHYTQYFTSVNRARLDLRFGADIGMSTYVDTAAERHVLLHPPNSGMGQASWSQEFERAGYAIFLRHEASTQTFLDDHGQGDPTQETRLGLELTFGNLAELERHPIALPYQAGVAVDHLLLGFNVPQTTRLTLSLRTYF